MRITHEALQLIQDYSPRHFQRLQRHVRFISYQRNFSGGQWDSKTSTCIIDFSRYAPEFTSAQVSGDSYYNSYLMYYAGVLIHEATHAYLESLGFPYTKKTYQRIEQLCNIEERRFWWAVYEFTDEQKQESLQRINLTSYDQFFHLSLWERIQKMREIIKEMNDMNREDSTQ
ncbi:hypothetical protein [Armatimonas sp.]|uniref:hypothetical protein n=1 Tax=Armatimonas sp. TaxID=1872638 RepID=UPI00286CCEAF|nr:hypothetical protein [Armatimonas sp.]